MLVSLLMFLVTCRDETHKVDVINFAQNKAKECSQNENLLDQESARLLWDFIVLMCRQNGVSSCGATSCVCVQPWLGAL